MAKVSEDLANTVAANTHINEVHFTATGHHYFNVHAHGKEKYGRVFRDTIIKDGKKQVVEAPDLNTKIVETLTREEIFGGKKKKD